MSLDFNVNDDLIKMSNEDLTTTNINCSASTF